MTESKIKLYSLFILTKIYKTYRCLNSSLYELIMSDTASKQLFFSFQNKRSTMKYYIKIIKYRIVYAYQYLLIFGITSFYHRHDYWEISWNIVKAAVLCFVHISEPAGIAYTSQTRTTSRKYTKSIIKQHLWPMFLLLLFGDWSWKVLYYCSSSTVVPTALLSSYIGQQINHRSYK